jgi:hypothetical protein
VNDWPPLIVTGMHRSGTSLLASTLVDAGVDLGSDLLGPDHQNPRGYFEDRRFLALERRILAAACPDSDPGWPDWGWTETEILDAGVIARHRDDARDVVGGRRNDRPWGWKDPRATLLLDFWDELLPDARYLFVYRPPWEVADSLLRYGHPALGAHPSFALRVWAFYNRQLLDFARRHPERCIVVALDAVTDRWSEVAAVTAERLGVPLATGAAPGVDPELLVRDAGALEDVTRDRAAWAISLFGDLERTADIPSSAPATARPDAAPAVSIVIPCFNGGPLLLEAVASCDRVRDVWSEVVVVDDGSDDPETCRLVDQLARLGYRVIRQANRGLSSARNAGVGAARGRYVLPLDHDNRIRPEYVARALDVMDRDPTVAVVYGDAQRFGVRDDRWEMRAFDLERMLRWNHVDACTVVRKKALEECGGYDDRLVHGAEDWDMWLGLIERGWRFHYVPEVLFDYRVRQGSMVTGLDRAGPRRDAVEYLVAKHRDLYAEHLPEVVAGLQQWIGELYTAATSLENEVDKLADRVGRAERDADELRAAATAAEDELSRIRATRTWRLRQRLLSLLRRRR